MTDQCLNLRPIASKAFYFVDGAEKIRVDIVVLDDTSGLENFFVMSNTGVRGGAFNAELLELVFVNGNANLVFSKVDHTRA